MKRTGRIVVTLVTVLLLVVMGACAPAPGEITPAPTPTPTPEEVTPPPTPEVDWGIIEIRVTDPPPPGVSSAYVTLTKIEVHKAVAEQEMEQSGSDDQTQEQEQQQTQQDEGEWLTIIDYEATFNLFDIIEEADILGSENVTAGKYTQIRMDVTKVEGLTSDNTTYTATVPSEKLKLVKPFEVKDGFTTILTIDFDGDKSLIVTGKDKFLFKPVIKLSVEYERLEEEEAGDTTPPEITVTGVTEGQVIVSPDTVTPEFSASDDTDPSPTVTATLLNGDEFTSGTEVSAVGEYELEVTAVDASGNEAEVTVNFEIVEADDTTPPEITITGVTDGQVIVSPDTVTPEFSASDDTDPSPTVEATLNGDEFTSGTEVSAVGTHELIVTAVDDSGNEAETTLNFEIVEE